MNVVVPFAAFGVICGVNHIRHSDISEYIYYMPFIILAIIIFFIGREKPALTLTLFSCVAACMMVVGLCTTGTLALFSFISGGSRQIVFSTKAAVNAENLSFTVTGPLGSFLGSCTTNTTFSSTVINSSF